MLWFGENARRPVKTDHRSDFIMDSAFNYYNKEELRLPYSPGQLFLDNGALKTGISTIADILKTKQAILVVEKGKAIGIITKHDIIEKGIEAKRSNLTPGE